MVAFLAINDWKLDADNERAESVMLSLAAGELDKAQLTAWVAANCHAKPSMELRSFFGAFDPATHFEHLGAFNAGSFEEQTRSLEEAAGAIPIVRHLHARALSLATDGKREEATAFFAAVGLLVSIHRVAEDSGYEW